MRPGGQASAATIERIKEATDSWLLLFAIWNKFGPSPDGAVERDLRSAEIRLREAVKGLDQY